MFWRSIRNNLVAELLTWIVLLVVGAVVALMGVRVSIPSAVVMVAAIVLFAWIYRRVSGALK